MKLSDYKNFDWDTMKDDYLTKTLHNSETNINSNNTFMIDNYNSSEEDDFNLDFDEKALYFVNPSSDKLVKNEEIISLKEYEEKSENKNENTKPFNCIKNQKINFENESKNIPSPIINISSNSNNAMFKPRKYFRVDDAKKHFKVAISQFASELLNNLIKESELPKRLKKKIHLPNSELFTSNPKEFDNYQFLSFDLCQVFTLGGNEENLKGDNLENIVNIVKNPKSCKIKENLQGKNIQNISNLVKNPKSGEIKKFLSLKYEEIIKRFYNSKSFNEFKQLEKTKFFEEGIKKEKNISLLDEDGLLKLFQMTKKKRKREIFSSYLQK